MSQFDDFGHESHMRRAFAEARAATERGDRPFGSVLVRDDEVVMTESNRVVTAEDVRRHPELHLAYRACREMDSEARAETVMYTSTEPCAMCSGGIYIASLGGVVYSVSAATAADLTGGGAVVPSAEILGRGDREVPVHGPVLETAGKDVHRECWPY